VENFAIVKIDGDIHDEVKALAARDGKTIKAWLSDVTRAELNRRQSHALDIKPLRPS